MKIYTRTGDTGETALFGGGRVPKDHRRVEAYGEVDELNACLGLAISAMDGGSSAAIGERLRLIQEDLFTIGAHLATPSATEESAAARHLPELPLGRPTEMEGWMDEADLRLEPLKNFILPGGSEAGARLHLARTVCRRAERRIISLAAAAPLAEEIVVYMNRLSDLLFTFARLANLEAGAGDVPWIGRR
jgi:cob(I)alamin adenosyltransferase